ncbi:DUF4334 domain-containing protein [Ensifer adhaerens]|uniref:DUF4334 domain-containing protein n=1 Tax=Ensifer adhaerens TaxID=106592 RepID=UPI001F1BEC7B|nr:DUF4334 domain-containing protein [Ensifer adhaerens]
MIYDRQPITDLFRRKDYDRVLAMMSLQGDPRPYFFPLAPRAELSSSDQSLPPSDPAQWSTTSVSGRSLPSECSCRQRPCPS